MTAVSAPVGAPGRASAIRRTGLRTARLVRLEARHNAMLWLLPVAVALFWLTTYRKTMAMPPLWNLRAANMQSQSVLDFAPLVAGGAAWMGSREARRRTTDLVTTTARPRWTRLLAVWTATTCWALVAYLVCLAVLYGVTAHQASWGGPLWWPAAVVAASLPALSALGFAAGTLLPGRFTAPLAAVAAFFILALSTQLIVGSQSYWQISPVVSGPWDFGPNAGVGTFYPYLPDLFIAQVMFLSGLTLAALGTLGLAKDAGGRTLRAAAAAITAAGLAAAGTAVGLAGTGQLGDHGGIVIPALHDAANDQPIRFTPVCSRTEIPVCLNPAYASYLPTVAAALEPVLHELAGLPGAPVKVTQVAATYQQEPGNAVGVSATGPLLRGMPPVYHLLLPDQLLGPALTASQLATQLQGRAGTDIVASVIGDGPGASQAQLAVTTALLRTAGLAMSSTAPEIMPVVGTKPSAAAHAAAQRFAKLPASVRHAWLVRHLRALRAGQITLAQLP